MKLHTKQIKIESYNELILGNKNFELIRDEPDYEVGDLIQFITEPENYLPANNLWEITYILRNVPEQGLEKGYCILALKRVMVEDYIEKTNLFPINVPYNSYSFVPYNSYSFINKNDETK